MYPQRSRFGPIVLLVAAAGLVLAVSLLQHVRASPTATPTCDSERCGWGATCKLVNNRPRCKCKEFCPMVYEPICGSDGKTYMNYCGMKQAGCNQQEELVKTRNGPCRKPNDGKDDDDEDEETPPNVGGGGVDLDLMPQDLKKNETTAA